MIGAVLSDAQAFKDFAPEKMQGGAAIIGLHPCTKHENRRKDGAERVRPCR